MLTVSHEFKQVKIRVEVRHELSVNDEKPGTYSPVFTDDAQVIGRFVLVAVGFRPSANPRLLHCQWL
jgi:hypothetical protein